MAAAVRLCAAAALSFSLAAAVEAADLAYRRAVDIARASPILPPDIVENARKTCDSALCFAEALTMALPDLVRLETVRHPDTDIIRRVTTAPSVTAEAAGSALRLTITHFGRKAVAELRDTAAAGNLPVVVDLRGNAGGDFERMLTLAGLLAGAWPDAIEIDHGDRIERRSLEGRFPPALQVVGVRIDEETASAALILARLLAARFDVALSGPAIAERPVFLKRRIPIDHDRRLILPVATLRIASP